MDKNKYMKHPT